jgi:hypothetical protein
MLGLRASAQPNERGLPPLMPQVGEALPDVEARDQQGRPFHLRALKGHFTVLVFGCLTCQRFLESGEEMEALADDCAQKGVKFYYVHKGLVHPGMRGFVEPYTQQERTWMAQLAGQELQSKIPWITDNDQGHLKRAFGKAANLELIVDPQGVLLHVSPWNNPRRLRALLSKHLGAIEALPRSEALTRSRELVDLLKQPPATPPLKKPQNLALLRVAPELPNPEEDYPLKLFVEAERPLLRNKAGRIYLRLTLDPLYKVAFEREAGVRLLLQPGKANGKTEVRASAAAEGMQAWAEAAFEAGALSNGLTLEAQCTLVSERGKQTPRRQRFRIALEEID